MTVMHTSPTALISICHLFHLHFSSPYCGSWDGVSTDVWAAGCSRVEVASARFGSPSQRQREHRQNAVFHREHGSSVGELGLVQDSCLNIAGPGQHKHLHSLWEVRRASASLLNSWLTLHCCILFSDLTQTKRVNPACSMCMHGVCFCLRAVV